MPVASFQSWRVASGRASKAALVQSRIKQLEKIERLPPPDGHERTLRLRLPEAQAAAEEALGFQLPNRRMEDWRWTDLRRLIGDAYPSGITAVGDATEIGTTARAASAMAGRTVRC